MSHRIFHVGQRLWRKLTSRSDKGIAQHLMTRIVLYWALYHLVFGMVLYAFEVIGPRMMIHVTEPSLRRLLDGFAFKYYPLLLSALLTFPLFIEVVSRQARRIAGPFDRFNAELRHMRVGAQAHRVQLREDDLMHELVSDINAYIEVYERQRRASSDRD